MTTSAGPKQLSVDSACLPMHSLRSRHLPDWSPTRHCGPSASVHSHLSACVGDKKHVKCLEVNINTWNECKKYSQSLICCCFTGITPQSLFRLQVSSFQFESELRDVFSQQKLTWFIVYTLFSLFSILMSFWASIVKIFLQMRPEVSYFSSLQFGIFIK